MHKNSDMNQVSMSSIEPAANTAGNHGHGHAAGAHAAGGEARVARQINETSENEGESDGRDVEVSDIPQFTIGPTAGAENPVDGPQAEPSAFQALSKDEKKQNFENFRKKYGEEPEPAEGEKSRVQKRGVLKKNVFESEMALATGRFEGGPHEETEPLSKSANQAKLGPMIDQPHEESPTG